MKGALCCSLAPTELRALSGPVPRWMRDLGEEVSQSMTWRQLRDIVDKEHGEGEKQVAPMPCGASRETSSAFDFCCNELWRVMCARSSFQGSLLPSILKYAAQ